MASDWNLFLERLLAAALTANEHRLALALARYTLGYRRRSSEIGEHLLRERSGITDGRGFERARAGLIEAGILRYTSSGPGGRGKRSTYELILDPVNPRSHAGVSETEKPPLSRQETPAPARALRGNRRERTSPATPATSIATQAADAYLGAGGSLDLDEWRGSLARQAATLAKRGVREQVIVAAARRLGREREFPGYLSQRADALEADGGPCSWEGLDRSRLTAEQLSGCECARCVEWLSFQTAEAAP